MTETQYTAKEYEPEQQAEHIFQLEPNPPGIPLNDYICRYKDSGDFRYIRFFLHRYEPTLNRIIKGICGRYGQIHNFEDIKQTAVIILIELLPEYDYETGAPFLAFAKPYVTAAIHRFIRKRGSFYAVENDNHYRELRRINAIYYKDAELNDSERIKEITRQTGKSEQNIRKLLLEGGDFRYYKSIFVDLTDATGEKYFEEWVADEYSNPETIVPPLLLHDDIVEAVELLPHRSQAILLRRLGILCLYCGRCGEPVSKEEVANRFELYSDSAVDRDFNKAVIQLTEKLAAKGWFRAMHIRLEKNDKKSAAVQYSYRPLLGTDKGLLEFDLTQPAEKEYIIDRLTPQDRQYPFFRRLVREVVKMQKTGQYVKEKLLVWWV